ncbi:MAG TPA: hypothetical protein VK549_18235 [Acidimicrobiia bacterium]|nr:hypothetical protein [Acidimicrobiia bacterium]
MTETMKPGLAARLGWRVERRPRPGFAHVLGAAAGAFVVVGVVSFVVEATSDDPTTPGVVFDLLLVAVALFVGLRAPGPIRSACVAAIVLAVPLVWFFGFFGGGSAGRGEIRGVLLLSMVSYLLLYFFGWTKARAIFLAGVLVFLASWVAFEVGDSNSSNVIPFQDQISSSSSSSNSSNSSNSPSSSDSSSFSTRSGTDDSTATAALIIGLVFLGTGAALDRRGYAGAATPFVAVGAIETLAGAIVLGGNESLLLGGVLAIVAGAAVGLVGGHGDRRRATTWIGVIAVFGGCIAIISDIAPNSGAALGGIAFGFALMLGSIAWWLAPVLGEPDDGNDPRPPTAPPGGTSGEGTTATLPDAAAA